MDMLKIENYAKKVLENHPFLKKSGKRIYQYLSFLLSKKKIKAEGNIMRLSPDDGYEYWFGYYDKSPWDQSDTYVLVLRAKKTYVEPASKEEAELGIIDTRHNNEFIFIAKTASWNVQQACMAQWLGPDFDRYIIYNDFRGNSYCSVLYDFKEKREVRVYDMPVYDVAKDGSYALSLDFSRLHRLRPGYGYVNISDKYRDVLCPDTPCIWKIDLHTGAVEPLFKYTDLNNFEHDVSMDNAEHKVNHLMISPDSKRLMFLHRWFNKGRKHSRLITVNIDKSEMYNLSDDVFVSHCFWKNNEEIISFLRKKEHGDHYYLLTDKTQEYQLLWPSMKTDGHCSYSFDGEWIITDTYPNNKRVASVFLCQEKKAEPVCLARVFSPFKYDNECRCDLHPRFNHQTSQVCFDSVHEGRRGLYVVSVKKGIIPDVKISVVVPTHNRSVLLKRAVFSALNQTYPPYEINVISDGSTDDTDKVMMEITEKYPSVHYYSYHPNKGGNYARNYGIKHSCGDYIAFLDDDDVWLNDKIYEQLKIIGEDENIGLVCTATNRIFADTGLCNIYVPPAEYDSAKSILLGNTIGSTTTVLVKKDLFEKAGYFDENLAALQDYDMWIRLSQYTKIGVVRKPCVDYYNYPGSAQISQQTAKYIRAEKQLSTKYQALIKKLSNKEQKKREAYFAMLLSKKGMRNGQKKIAISYGTKALLKKPSKSTLICFVAAFLPYKLTMKIQNKSKNRGI